MTSCADVISASNAAFGTSGVRGLVEDLDDATCFAFAAAFLAHLQSSRGLKSGSKVWIGHDRRPSSPAIAHACWWAVKYSGCTPVYCGETPTPSLAHLALQNAEPAIMITGSHIPFDRNGIKFYRSDGEILKDDETPVVNSATSFPDEWFSGKHLDRENELPIVADRTAAENWHDRYVSAFGNLLANKTIGHYQHSAAGRDDLAELLIALGAKVIPLGRSEIFVPVDTEAVSDADQQQAQLWCRQHNLDAIISTDGDGDRPLLSDEQGSYFRGDALGILAAYALGANTVVTPVSSNTALEKSGYFSSIARTKIGSPHVIAAMQEYSSDPARKVVGFEANGGFLTASRLASPTTRYGIEPLPTRDAVLPVLAAFSLVKTQNLARLSDLGKLLPSRITASDRLENTAKEKSLQLIQQLGDDQNIAARLSLTAQAPVMSDDTDGLRLTFANDDIVHLRPSGNAPELRIYVESGDVDEANALLGHAKSVVMDLIA